jgi:hypothetical protein
VRSILFVFVADLFFLSIFFSFMLLLISAPLITLIFFYFLVKSAEHNRDHR